MTTRKQTLKAWGELALYVLAPFSMVKDIPVPNYDKSELLDIMNVIKSDINEHEKLEAEHEALIKDVARYFELISKCPIWTLYENNEFHKLDEKLSKVGKEE